MKAKMYFAGCSCGCTPSETYYVTAETREGLIYGVADQMCNYAVYGKDPFRKCYLESIDPSDIDRNEIRELGLKLFELSKKIHEKKVEYEKKKFKAPYRSSGKKYPLTDEQIAVNENAKKAFDKDKEEMKKEIDKLKKDQQSFYRDYNTEGHYDYDD